MLRSCRIEKSTIETKCLIWHSDGMPQNFLTCCQGKGSGGAFCPAFLSEACVFAGDIGTSPLYVMSSTFYANDGAPRPSTDDVVGVTSLIVWTITWIVVRPLMKRCHALSTHCREYEGGFALSGKHEHNMDCKWQ